MCIMAERNFSWSCELFNFLVCAVFIGLVCVAGLMGNVTSFMVLLKHKTETTAVILLQCMALADSMLLLTTLFIYSFPSLYSFTGWLSELHDACDVIKIYVWPVAMITHTITIWLTVLVTWNRFCACCRPIGSYRKLTVPAVRLQVLGVVVLSMVYNMPRFFEHQPIAHTYNRNNNNNNVDSNRSHSSNTSGDGGGGGVTWNGTGSEAFGLLANSTTEPPYVPFNLGDSRIYQIVYSNIFYFPVMYIVPLLSMSYLNMRLIRSLKAIRMKKQTLTGHRPKEDHITRCVVVIVICFILCQTPALVNQIFWAVLDNSGRACGRFHFYYTKLSDALVVVNSSCNFVIYCLFGKSFRKIFVDTLCRSGRTPFQNRTQTCLNELGDTDGTTLRKKSATCEVDTV